MMDDTKTKQQDYEDLMSNIESIYGKQQIETFCKYAEMSQSCVNQTEFLTINNSSVNGY